MNMKKAIFCYHKEYEYVHAHVIEVHFLIIKHVGYEIWDEDEIL